MRDEWQRVDTLAVLFRDHFETPPKVVVVLGSGLGQVAEHLDDKQSVFTSELDGYPESTVSGHRGVVHCGTLKGVPVMILEGRVHLYEGYSPAEVVRPLRAAVTFGAQIALLTNAAGGIDPGYAPGQLMLISDHLNLTGKSPLTGPNDDTRGPRFPDMTDIYDSSLRVLAKQHAEALGISLAEGIYAGLLGPTYETPAEVCMLAVFGATAVGMSTVQEAIACRHLGARLLGISCITNPAAGISKTPLNHEEVEQTSAHASLDLAKLIISLTGALS
jgi:purine-nucleoside phosphorylase